MWINFLSDFVREYYQKKGRSKLAQKTSVRNFGKSLWEAVQARISPTPRGLRIEVNPGLKRHYSAENRTLIFRLFISSPEGMIPQFYYGTSRGAEMGSSYTKLLEQRQAAQRELQVQKQMIRGAQEHIEKMEAATEITEQTSTTGAGYEQQLRRQGQDKSVVI